nr:unnamed protein product [Callosobruchus analis]
MDISCYASGLQYKHDHLEAGGSKSGLLDYLAFKFAIAESLMFQKKPQERKKRKDIGELQVIIKLSDIFTECLADEALKD